MSHPQPHVDFGALVCTKPKCVNFLNVPVFGCLTRNPTRFLAPLCVLNPSALISLMCPFLDVSTTKEQTATNSLAWCDENKGTIRVGHTFDLFRTFNRTFSKQDRDD